MFLELTNAHICVDISTLLGHKWITFILFKCVCMRGVCVCACMEIELRGRKLMQKINSEFGFK